ncbi:hypothetical protein [Falsiroseomonas oryzae]|uniref:hypothetical protein n=1 Tax=Falsiroseomonas oryzae TaxID=2766473 RepID=UPI0022EAE27C|nr:hypothetical protein [Roseomonas sp. MO-31]
MDALAYYAPHHWRLHRPAIVMCPELLLEAALGLRDVARAAGHPGKVVELYPVILAAVTIHELAHAAMCSEAHLPCSVDRDWAAVSTAIDGSDKQHGLDALRAATNFNHACACSWRHAAAAPLPSKWEIVEESLATAIALAHFPPGPARSFLDAWVEKQSPPYRAGLLWQLDLGRLVDAGQDWARLKSLLLRSGAGDPTAEQVLRALAAQLRDGQPITALPNFGGTALMAGGA